MNAKEKLRIKWQEQVNNYFTNRKSMRQWCSEENLKIHQLQYWCKKYKKEPKESNLYP